MADSYAVCWLRRGFRRIEIDLDHNPVEPNSIFFICPGQSVILDADDSPAGWIISFSPSTFVEVARRDLTISDAHVMASTREIPRIILSPKIADRVSSIAEMIDELVGSEIPGSDAAATSLLKTLLIYCDSKCNIRIEDDHNRGKLQIASEFKSLVAKHFSRHHLVKDYAQMMNLSPKYLNQIVREVMGVTAKSVIQEQLTIQARRELKFSNHSVKEIAFKLGFNEPFHFSSYFKKQVGHSPTEYRGM